MSDVLEQGVAALRAAGRFNAVYDAADGRPAAADLLAFRGICRGLSPDARLVFRAKVTGHIFVRLAGREAVAGSRAVTIVEGWFPRREQPTADGGDRGP